MRNNALSLFKALPDKGAPAFEPATVLAVGNGSVDVRMADGTVYRHIPLSGGATVGGSINVQFSGGKPQAFGAGGGAGSGGGGLVLGGAGSGATGTIIAGNGLTGGGVLGAGTVTLAVGAGDGVSVAADTVGVDSTVVRTSRTLLNGIGINTIGDLSANRTISVNYTNGLNNYAGAIGLGTPSTLAVGSTNSASGTTHTHAITSSSNPGAAASLLASDASGYLSLVRLTTTDRLRTPTIDTASGDLTLSPATNNTAASRITLSDRLRTPTIDTASGSLTLSPAQDITLNPGSGIVRLMSPDVIMSDGYTSQTTGMRITHAGEGDFRYIYTDELHAKAFIADLEMALAGGQIIAKSVALLAQDFTMPASGSSGAFIVRDLPSATGMRVFENRDIVRFRSFNRANGGLSITDAWGEVTLDTTYGVNGFDSATKTQRYTYLRRTGVTIDDQNNDPITDENNDPILANNINQPEGAMAGGTVIAAESVVLDYGKNKSGIHEVNAIDGIYGLNSPYAQTVSWSIHPKNAAVRTRIGNLRGIFGIADEFGLYAGSGTANADQYIRISTEGVRLNNVPLALYSGNSQRVNIDQDGVNVWFSSDGGTTRQLSWNGSTLSITGSITVTGGNAATNTYVDSGLAGKINTGGAAADVNANTTTISGGKIRTGIVQSTNWGASAGTQFNLDSGALLIGGSSSPALSWNGSTLSITGSITVTGGNAATNTYVDSGLAGKINTGGAAADVNANTTTISGGKITTGSVTADRLNVSTLSAITANMGTVTAGEILLGNATTFGGSFTGLRMRKSGTTYELGGYNAGTVQAYFDSNGNLMAGGGAAKLDSAGVTITHNAAYNSNPTNTDPQSLKFYSTGYDVGGTLGTYQLAAVKKGSFSQSITTYKGLDFSALSVYEPVGGNIVSPTFFFSFDGTRKVTLNGPNGTVDVNGTLYTSGDATIAGSIATGARVPRSSGTALFALDSSGTGSTITLANAATSTPFGNANNFSGLILITNTTNNSAAVFLAGGGTVTLISESVASTYSATSGTANRINVYYASNVITIQNNSGGSRTMSVTGLRIKAGA